MSSERLARIGEWLDGVIERREASGFVTLVARRGKIVHYEARGTRGLTVLDPLPEDGIFDMASMTKPITVVAALSLFERGLFTLDDPISEYLPEFKNPRIALGPHSTKPAESEIIVRQLFTHTSCVSDPRGRNETFAFPTLKEYVSDAARLPLACEPGSRWVYGDSHDVLGRLVEAVAGRPLDRYVAETIFDPLGMTESHYWPPASKDSRRAILVVRGQDDLDSTSRRPLEAARRATFIGGASGLYSTAADYWRFSQMLLNGGALDGERILGPRTVDYIAKNHLRGAEYDRPGTTFGLGFAVVDDPAALGYPYSEGSYFWGGSQGTTFWIDPAEELIGVLMVQSVPRPKIRERQKFAQIVYAAITD